MAEERPETGTRLSAVEIHANVLEVGEKDAIGGVLLVALLNYGQVVAEREGREEGKGGKEESEKEPGVW